MTGGTSQRLKALTTLCIGGLILGLAAGLFLGSTATSWSGPVLDGMEAVIRAWTNALRLIVTPLVVAQLYAAIAAGRLTAKGAGRLGLVVPMVFLALLVMAALFTVAVGRWAVSLPVFAGIGLGSPAAGSAPSGGPIPSASGAGWVDGVIPPNLISAAGTDNIFPLMLFTLAFALAGRRLSEPLQRILDHAAQATRDALFVLVQWLLLLAPLVMLALGIRAGAADGLRVGAGLLAFILLESALLLLAIGALYPLTALFGRVSIRRFAQAALPGQLAAVGTRSSLATIPVLLRSARETLELPPPVAPTVLPLAGAMLKLSRAVVDSGKLVFLAHVLGLPIGAQDLAVFLVMILLLSPVTAGVPSMTSSLKALPAYVAVGVPAEYVVLLGPTNSITDVFRTVLNTTSYLSASVLVARFSRGAGRAAAPDSAPSLTAEGALP